MDISPWETAFENCTLVLNETSNYLDVQQSKDYQTIAHLTIVHFYTSQLYYFPLDF